ncbi:MAG: DUF4062 domain-containing protein [Paludibacter sp.]|nr:DUF4062 domain-containing protein [Paludibacter sp.]
MKRLKVFISSVQSEFASERETLYRHIENDPFLKVYFEPMLFEKMPASSKSADQLYLDGVRNADVFIVLIGNEYGNTNAVGISATEHEFDTALISRIDSFAFIKEKPTGVIHPREKAFLQKIQKHVTYKRFDETYDLIQEINRAFVGHLQQIGFLLTTAFDATMHPVANLNDIDTELINDFLDIAVERRNFPFRRGNSIKKVLIHLNLLSSSDKIKNSALLAFSTNPQKYFPSAIVKCAHFHGYIVEKPIPNHQVIKGTVFEQVSEAVDFVLAKISVSVGVRNKSIQAPIAYEIPRAVITEAIVNAIAHRDYMSNGSVEVWLFKDRLEVRNPGHLPKELSLDKLELDHSSYPYNPNLAEVLYQAGLIERFGTGTVEIFRLTEQAGLQKPDFDTSEGFKVVIWRKPHNQQDKSILTAHDTAHDTADDTISEVVFLNITELTDRVVWVMKNEMSREELMVELDLKHRQNFSINYLEPSLKLGLLEMTIPDKPKSKLQKYKLTAKGVKLQKKIKK